MNCFTFLQSTGIIQLLYSVYFNKTFSIEPILNKEIKNIDEIEIINSNNPIEKNENNYLYFGKIQAGDYVLKTDEQGNILSLVVENAQILIDFE